MGSGLEVSKGGARSEVGGKDKGKKGKREKVERKRKEGGER